MGLDIHGYLKANTNRWFKISIDRYKAWWKDVLNLKSWFSKNKHFHWLVISIDYECYGHWQHNLTLTWCFIVVRMILLQGNLYIYNQRGKEDMVL